MDISNSLLNWYKKLKQILEDNNIALANKGLNEVNNLFQIPSEIEKLGEINRLPYLLGKNIIDITESDLRGVITIESDVFKNCKSLKNLIISEDVTTISHSAFFNCTNLENVIIGSNVRYIGTQAFYTCTNLTNIYCHPVTPPYLSDSGAFPNITTIHVPIGSGEAYKSATNWSRFASQIVEDIVI